MNFPRPSLVRSRRSRPNRPRFSLLRALALPVTAAVPVIAFAVPVLAAPAAIGVPAWTSGSQTYLRARPSQNTPIVAKVAKHTPLYVWGKFDGWYRVETHDHIFGWVHYELLNAPNLDKVRELSHSRAIKASQRNGNQTLYGKPQQLAKYFKNHGAPGAVAGLRDMGVKVSFGPRAGLKPGAKAKPKPVAAKPAPKAAAKVKPVALKIAPRAASKAVVSYVAPKPQPKPVAAAPKPKAAAKAVALKIAPKAAATARAPRTIVSAPPAPKPALRAAAPQARPARITRTAAPRAIAPAPRPAAKTVTGPIIGAAVPVIQVPSTPATPVKLPPASPAKVAATASMTAPAKPVGVKKAAVRPSARDQKRQQLRAKMGMTDITPPLPIKDIAPVSPEELMKARRAYLDARKKKFGAAPTDAAKDPAKDAAPAPNDSLGGPRVTPSSFRYAPGLDEHGWAPFNTGGWNANPARGAIFADWDASRAPGFQLIVDDKTAANNADGDAEMDNGETFDWFNLPTLRAPKPALQTRSNAQKKPAAVAKAPSRGGSPRDRYANSTNDFRSGMANQALAYRGMPYIRGASSPSRGFDCSGLIYFLLRQRGYNPPRTAAGYARYGTPVARGQWAPGDLLLFANTYKRGISHIGIYLGNNNFVHAASTRQGVRVDSMATKYFASKYWGARRVPGK